jgi:hypothetical protein
MRAIQLARSVPMTVLPKGREIFFPGFDKIVLLAIATGSYRDTLNSAQACLK